MSLPELDALREAGILAPLDVHFAHTMARLGADPRPAVLLAAALASRAVQHGHVCLDLARWAGQPVGGADGLPLAGADGRPRDDLAWPALGEWRAALADSPLVGDGDAATPLVLDGADRLYLRRYWQHEAVLAARLRARAAEVAGAADAAAVRDGLARLFGPPGRDGGVGDQRRAAEVAAARRLCVITGGPGTGKTTTVVRIIALVVEAALARGGPAPRIALVAPTGKAAARLTEAVRRARDKLDVSDAVRDAIPEAAATIHRTLGSLPDVATRFRHDADHPLRDDVVVVDEASMVDAALMRRLVDALRPSARLVLLGDKDQLASVEAGAVLGDICGAGALRDCVVGLTHSYRFGPDSGIGALARAVNAGDADAALAILTGAGHPDVTLVTPTGGGRARDVLDPALARCVVDGYRPYLQAAAVLAGAIAGERTDDGPGAGTDGGAGALIAAERACLDAFDGFRVLGAHRQGRDGVDALNPRIARVLADAGWLDPTARMYLGRPVIVTRNDYDVRLFNGDIGVVLPDPARPGRRRVVFAAADGGVRALAAARLPAHDTAFALSVHKAQGSEFDTVAVVLPDSVSPVLSRELLYTAVTRARRAVTVFGSEAVVRAAIERPIERASGLASRLG